MENEKHFYPSIESKERLTREYTVNFLSSFYPDAKKTEKTYDTAGLVGMLNTWWDKICTERGLSPKDKKVFNIGYHVIELGKNALEHAHGGEIKVIFEPDKITVIVSDQGQGFENYDDVEYSTSSQYGHGLYGVRKYADDFSVETGGKKYVKEKGKKKLVDTGISDITTGSKITFIKKF